MLFHQSFPEITSLGPVFLESSGSTVLLLQVPCFEVFSYCFYTSVAPFTPTVFVWLRIRFNGRKMVVKKPAGSRRSIHQAVAPKLEGLGPPPPRTVTMQVCLLENPGLLVFYSNVYRPIIGRVCHKVTTISPLSQEPIDIIVFRICDGPEFSPLPFWF